MAQAALASTEQYNYDIVRKFTFMAIVWLVVGMAAGVYIALELAFPALNLDSPQLTFGRLRPVHTTAVIFGFGGSALFATSYYIVQRTCQARLISDGLASFVFWGWQLVIVLAAITLPLGITTSKEYAELEWPIDILIALVWLAFMFNFIMTIATRKSSHIYVANWFFLGMMMILLFAVNLRWLPVSGMYAIYGGGDLPDLLRHLVMPALALAVVATGVIARLSRSAMLEVLKADYIRTARAKGISETAVILKHALRNALAPVITVLGLQLGYLFGGIIVVESLFNYSGMGWLTYHALLNRDVPLIQASVFLIAAVFMLSNLIVDLIYRVLDPRIRFE